MALVEYESRLRLRPPRPISFAAFPLAFQVIFLERHIRFSSADSERRRRKQKASVDIEIETTKASTKNSLHLRRPSPFEIDYRPLSHPRLQLSITSPPVLPSPLPRALSPDHDRIARRRGRAPADLRHHLPSRRRQDHPDRAPAAGRRRDPAGGRGAGARRAAADAVGLDEDRARARHLRLGLGDDLRSRGPDVQPARHPGPRGLLGRHLPHPDRRRRRGHGAGRRARGSSRRR